MNIFELAARVVLTFLILLALTRIMGRKEISQLTFFNFVSAITLGAIGGAVVIDPSLNLRDGLLALIGWSIVTIAMGFLHIKSRGARKLLEGEPVVVMKDGKILEGALRKLRLDLDALTVLLREKDVFSFSDVSYAILEVDGKLSVVKKENQETAPAPSIHISGIKQHVLPVALEIVSDGTLNQENAGRLHITKEWLEQQLRQIGILSLADVFYAEVQQDGTLYVDRRQDLLHESR
ncbi:YetF domain-containing protein [Ectobacillus ponti]|uniref:DUF421 domain-containing protein n=1 Tax=Ectobacillus ponti TaxID=2961894 RepID=A0AA42BPM5_9BACI|nr:DUF421 domain-containing protein [Ectobacillus ponti]MCP8969295.1 DUF421 domain-containing protein [Ectobacillus ponti]